jgi:DnaJ-class molecular chaperone
VPVQQRCGLCHGRGAVGYYACPRCHGNGTVQGEAPVVFGFPPGISDGEVAELSLARLGSEIRSLTLIFRVPR